jgi:hemolysin D
MTARILSARFTRDEREFLPAALEIVESPPSPTARWTGLIIMSLLAAALLWSCLGRLDIVAVAEGRIIPSGRVKIIQPLEPGVIRAIHVQDGMAVRQGQVLVELDPTSAGADRERQAGELAAAEVSAARLRALLAATSIKDLETAFTPPPSVAADLVTTQRQLMIGQWNDYEARLGVMRDEATRRRGERASVEAAIAGFNRTIPILRERQQIRATLESKGFGSRVALLEDSQRLATEERELAVQRERLVELTAAVKVADNQARQFQTEARRTLLTELTDTERKIASLRQDLIRADLRQQQQTLRAPIDGVVQQLSVHTIGGVVTQAQQLMVIVPDGDTLEIEAALQNRDVGFVQAGQPAEIKIETFLFTRYGTIPGRVVSVSADAIVDPNRTATSDQAASPVYVTRVRLDRATLDVDGRTVRLAPGMRASVEVKTGRRRVIEYLLSPLIRYRDESLRER